MKKFQILFLLFSTIALAQTAEKKVWDLLLANKRTEAQKLFEDACNNGALCEDLELSATMYFDRKDRNGQYMCCTTLAVFNIFCKGLDAGFEHNP